MNENPNITPEQTEEAVRQLQTFLDQLAFFEDELPFVAVSGIFDEDTRRALEIFQRLYRLPVTGKADRLTWDRLYGAYLLSRQAHSRPVPISPFPRIDNYIIPFGEESELVGILHHMLRTLRLVHDDLGDFSDGIRYDGATESAIRIYQKKNGLAQSGQVDRLTWDTLAKEYNLLVNRDE